MLKAIIFDVGGVLIISRSRAGREKWAARLGMDSWEFENFIFSGESGRQTQMGLKTTEAHWQWLGEYFGLDENGLAEMRRDFFAGDALNERLLQYVKQLRRTGYKTGLLSNFGDNAHYVWREVYPIIDHFDAAVVSAEVGVMKPDPRIYHLAAARLQIQPAEAVFVDDFIENVEGAQAVGMQAVHFTDTDTVIQQLTALTGVKPVKE